MMKTDFTRVFPLRVVMVDNLGTSTVQAKKKTMEDSDSVDIATVPIFHVKLDG